MLKCGDIIKIPFPFSDRDFTKGRPALVLSDSDYTQKTDHMVLAMITTAQNSHWYNDTPVLFWREAGLNAPCVIRQKFATLEVDGIMKHVGHLHEKDFNMFKNTLVSSVLSQLLRENH